MADNISKYNKSLTAAEKAERGRKAGKRSGKVRRENRRLKEALLERLTDDDLTAIVDGLISRAKRNTRDFEVLRDSIGQKPRETVSVAEAEPVQITVRRSDD